MSLPEVTPGTPPPPPLDTALTPPPPPDATITAASPPIPSTAGSPPPTDNATVAPSPPSRGLSGPTLTALGVGAGLGGLIVLIAVGFFVLFYRRRKRKSLELLPTKNDQAGLPPQQWSPHAPAANNMGSHPKHTHPPGTGEKQQSPTGPNSAFPGSFSSASNSVSVGSDKPFSSESMSSYNSTFTFEELARATNNFSSDNILGQGGFGYVHKGFLPNGKEVAVKALKIGSGQGEREFQAEVETISRVHHRHLVSLVGYCMSGEKRLLVYEFVPNKTLEFHLHGEGSMNWQLRLKIAVGAAKGLAYLHEDCNPKIIHRDIKAANILIDNHFEAKVADFGLAKFSYDNDTHVSTRVMGTFGYLAPEYAASGKLTEKSDVFSFGIVLLELISGRRPIDRAQAFLDDSMVEWARPLLRRALEDGIFEGLVDPKLEEYDAAELSQMIACADVCVRQSARRRPYMSQVVRALEGNLTIDELCKEKSPGASTVFGSSDYDHSQQYKEDLKRFRKLALEGRDESTSEFSAVTSEYGAQPSTSSTENQPDTQETDRSKTKKEGKDVHEIPIL